MADNFSIDGSISRNCEASLILDDAEFLPITYTFDASQCAGPFVASFDVPRSLPTGYGYITWWVGTPLHTYYKYLHG